ncbi:MULTISPECIES: hypothetical protein [Streptomyces]|uniref:Uncharacterized protein n=1 Tax=Streptomyces rimosus TaxID=1927 RepID=A0A8F7PXK6_STRRM|nr:MULTISPECIES: hypothetical protein [Streptomyces]QDA10265.1 hypothetical protein CTZ40_41540 [Streptomyces rimosus]QGY70853.1 hypothetical protein V519_037655 [Streptomyces rimosus R6-500]QXV92079.1 hypothetical protein M4018_082770 [Streptomyces rimosus]QXV92348.1 hypothetical protein R6500_082770 [Streptomyces rimosus]
MHPLALGRNARARLGGAVRALLDVPGLEGVPDAVRLAVLVLASRTPSETGVVEIRTSELGRWLGLSASYTASNVVPVLRRSGVVSVDTAEGEFGQDDGLECRVLPLWAAQDMVGHPLNLSKRELAVLLRLLEAVMAPGWTHRDGRVTPAGLLGSRTGRGAPTDRLALLLLVLEARETGRVRLCGGTVDTKRGRPAVTLARLLGCKAAAGERVLERLEDRGLVRRVRVQTASDLAHRTRLMVPAVAAAHGRAVAGGVREDRTEARKPDFSDPDGAAGAGEMPEAGTEPQVSGVPVTDEADVAEPDAAATLHTDHPGVVAEVGESADVGGFSGYGREGSGDLPGRAGAREGRTSDRARRLALAGGSGGPLRGEQQTPSPCPQHTGSEQAADAAWAGTGRDAAAELLAGMGGCSGGGLRGRGPRPRSDLRVALAPVEVLWDRLKGRGSRGVVEKAARRELRRVADWLGEDRAEQYLAERLTRRLTAQRGRAFGVKDPVGWLLGRGLPRHSDCGDLRCDEGVLMHTGAACALCEDVVLDLRGRRRRVAAEVEAGLPGATSAQQREVFEDRLREVVAADAARCRARRREQEAQAAASQARAAEVRARREVQEAARRTMPCAQCGMPRAGGLCPVCREHRETEKLIEQAVAFVAGGCADLDDPDLASALVASAETEARTRIQDACAQLKATGGTEVTIALAGRGTAELIAHEYRATALRTLGCGPRAEAEARSAHAAQLRRRHLHPCAEAAEQAAEQAAAEARSRAAEHLLAQRATAWLTARTQGPDMTPELQERSAAYEAGAARARAAAAAHAEQDSTVRPGMDLLARPEPDAMKAAAEAEETARLRAQIATQLPGLAAWTATHHGVIYDMPAHPAAGSGS